MDITVKIEAPELVAAVNTLAAALETWNHGMIAVNCKPTSVQTPEQAPLSVAPTAQAQPVTPLPVTPAPAPIPTAVPAPVMGTAVPTAAQTYTMEQLAVAATQLVDAGRRAELVALLASFGVQALTALPKEQYGNFATQLRAMGAKI